MAADYHVRIDLVQSATLDQQQTNYSDDSIQWTYQDDYVGQTFKAGLSGDLQTVKLYFGKYGTPANLLVQIQGTVYDGGKGYYIPDNTPLASEEIAESNISATPSEVTVTFTTPATVVAGTRYAIIMRQKADGGDGSNYYEELKGDRYGGDVYVDGKYIRTSDGGTNWYKLADFDAYFKTYVITIAEYEVLEDINNDFRIAGEILDVNNDFRAFETEIKMDVDNDFRSVIEVLEDINNKFNSVKEQTIDFLNNFIFTYEAIENIINVFIMTKDSIDDIGNDFRTKKKILDNVNNDFRMLSPWQVPLAGEIGFQSAGKPEVIVYINSAEQTDADINSININESLNVPSLATFTLGRAYDATKPAMDSDVEIKYKGILLYKGYITEINPADSPESIRISCQDEYWNLNKTKKYFLVGRKPTDANEYYYETTENALNGLGFSYGIGNFIPQTMDLYGIGLSDAISILVRNSGNFNWFIKPDGSKVLWEAGQGNIINLQPQELGKNLGLYQVIKHSFRESIVGLVNKFRVQMGNKTVRESTRGSGKTTNVWTWRNRITTWATPAWNTKLEAKAQTSNDGYGWDNKDPNEDYKDVFRKYWLPDLSPKTEAWSDVRPPVVEIYEGIPYFNSKKEYKKEGFTLDYESIEQEYGNFEIVGYGFKPAIIFSEPQVEYTMAENGVEATDWKAKSVKLHLIKERKVTPRDTEQTSPDEEPDAMKLMFYTDKWGDYPETIMEDLNLSGLSIQEGYMLYDDVDTTAKKWIYDVWGKLILTTVTLKQKVLVETIPSWDDTEYAKDIADWKLTDKCDKKIIGSIDLTIDGAIYYNIDLSKRIKIDGVVDPISIKSITYNFNTFTATLELENSRYYKRTVSYPFHGE